jgi:hypothetical protein
MAEARCPADGDENAELCESRAARLIDASVLIRHMLRRLLFLLSRRCRAVFNFKASEFGVAGVALHTPVWSFVRQTDDGRRPLSSTDQTSIKQYTAMQLRRTIECATSATLLLNVLIPHAVSGQDDADDVWASPSSDVLQLTKSNFAPTVYHSGKNGMVAFIQKWCGHSIKLIP